MRKTISSLHADFVTVKNKTVFNEISFRQSHILEANCFVRCLASRRVMPRKIRFESVWRVKIVNSIGILRLRVGRAGLWSVRKRERLGILVNVKSNAVSREIWTLRKKNIHYSWAVAESPQIAIPPRRLFDLHGNLILKLYHSGGI